MILSLIYLIIAVGTFLYCLHSDPESFCEAYPTWRNKVAIVVVWLALWWAILGSAILRKLWRAK